MDRTPTANCPLPTGASGWTFICIALGIGLIACCLLVPQADQNRAMVYQCEKLKRDLAHINKQVEVNDEFVRRIDRDPALAERLAQRQLKYVRKGAGILELPEESSDQDWRSPFALTTVPPPPPLAPPTIEGGKLANLCRDTKTRLYLIGGGLMLLAVGLVLGHSPKPS